MGKKRRKVKERKQDVEVPIELTPSIPGWLTNPILLSISLLLVILLSYSPSLKGITTLDDTKIINSINAIDHLPRFLNFRSVSYMTFYINKSIGGLTPFNLRLTNIMIHLINSILVYLIVLLSLNVNREVIMEVRYRYLSAWITSFIFALHPLNINGVSYIVQRMASLATLFILLSLILYIKASISQGGIKAWSLYLLSIISLILGIFSKENAVVGIPLILLYDYVFLNKLNIRMFSKKLLPAIITILVVIIITSLSLRFHKTIYEILGIFINMNQPLTHRAWMTTDVSWTPLQHILTEFRVVSRYIILFFIPLPRFMVFDGWGYPISEDLTTPPTTFLSVLFIIGILTVSIIKRRQYPFLFFGIAWYLIAISLESFLAVGSDLYFEHRNYLPLSGLLIGLVTQSFITLKPILQKRISLLIICIAIMVLSILTFQRNLLWQDFLGLWIDTIEKLPTNTRAMVTVGKNYFLSSKYDDARYYLEGSLRYALQKRQSYFYQESALFLGEIYLIQGRFQEAEELIKVFHRRVPSSHKLMILKGLYLSCHNRFEEATAFFNKAIEEIERQKQRKELLLYIGLADIYRMRGMTKEAEDTYRHIIEDYPSNSLAYYGIAMLYLQQGRFDLAEKEIDRLLSIFPDDVLALSAKGLLIIMKRGRIEDAIHYTQKALSTSDSFYEPYLNTGTILIKSNKEGEAEEFFKKASTLHRQAPQYMIDLSKGIGYALRGDVSISDGYFQGILNDENIPQGVKSIIRNNFSKT
ncbi:MAG: hypothetical protein Fur0020_05810 [Thermodesulfovibrionia bacterium]